MAVRLIGILCLFLQFAFSVPSIKLVLQYDFWFGTTHPIIGCSLLPGGTSGLLLVDSLGNLAVIGKVHTFVHHIPENLTLLSSASSNRCTSTCKVYACNELRVQHQTYRQILSFEIYYDRSEIYVQNSLAILYSFAVTDPTESCSIVLDKEDKSLFFNANHNMLRISAAGCVDSQSCGLFPNPFGNETFALGLRNLSWCYFDSLLFKPVCINKGKDQYDEVDIIYIRSNYGWPVIKDSECLGSDSCSYPLYYERPVGVVPFMGKTINGFIYRGFRLGRSFVESFVLLLNNKLNFIPRLTRNLPMMSQEIKILNDNISATKIFLFSDDKGEIYLICREPSTQHLLVYSFLGYN